MDVEGRESSIFMIEKGAYIPCWAADRPFRHDLLYFPRPEK